MNERGENRTVRKFKIMRRPRNERFSVAFMRSLIAKITFSDGWVLNYGLILITAKVIN